MRSLFALLLAIPLILAGPGLAEAAGKNKGKGKPAAAGQSKGSGQGSSGDATTGQIVGAIITAAERAIIGDYVHKARNSTQGLPPGLANRGQLPPGLQKHIQRTGALPPGLEKRRLPGDLRGLLPTRSGLDYRAVGDDVFLIETATRVILDVRKGVLRN